jgi:hypothetical protein
VSCAYQPPKNKVPNGSETCRPGRHRPDICNRENNAAEKRKSPQALTGLEDFSVASAEAALLSTGWSRL